MVFRCYKLTVLVLALYQLVLSSAARQKQHWIFLRLEPSRNRADDTAVWPSGIYTSNQKHILDPSLIHEVLIVD